MTLPVNDPAEQMRLIAQMPDEALAELDKLTRRIDCLGERVRWEIRERNRKREVKRQKRQHNKLRGNP